MPPFSSHPTIYTAKNDVLKITIIHVTSRQTCNIKKITMFYSKNCYIHSKNDYVDRKNCYVLQRNNPIIFNVIVTLRYFL